MAATDLPISAEAFGMSKPGGILRYTLTSGCAATVQLADIFGPRNVIWALAGSKNRAALARRGEQVQHDLKERSSRPWHNQHQGVFEKAQKIIRNGNSKQRKTNRGEHHGKAE